MSNGHSKFGASSAYRWLACPGSIKLCEKAPERKESDAAAEGTRGHECLELILKNGPHKQLASERFLREKYPHEMVIHAGNAARTVWELAPKGAEILAEEKVLLTHIDEDCGGTLDASAVEHFGDLHVFDYKYGRHIPVEVENNSQMLMYAIGKAHEHHYNFDRVMLTIIQPRAEHAGGPVRTWVTTVAMLHEWNRRFKDGVRAAKKKDAPLKAGDHCFFCDAKPICKAFDPAAMKGMRGFFARPRTEKELEAQLALDFGEPFDCDEPAQTSRKKEKGRRSIF